MEYKSLLFKSEEQRRALVYGSDLYTMLSLAKKNLPENTTFSIVGLENHSVEHRRAIYYLYPFSESQNPQYVLVYKTPGTSRKGYNKTISIDGDTFILVKVSK